MDIIYIVCTLLMEHTVNLHTLLVQVKYGHNIHCMYMYFTLLMEHTVNLYTLLAHVKYGHIITYFTYGTYS